jgi:hypothetical protein
VQWDCKWTLFRWILSIPGPAVSRTRAPDPTGGKEFARGKIGQGPTLGSPWECRLGPAAEFCTVKRLGDPRAVETFVPRPLERGVLAFLHGAAHPCMAFDSEGLGATVCCGRPRPTTLGHAGGIEISERHLSVTAVFRVKETLRDVRRFFCCGWEAHAW